MSTDGNEVHEKELIKTTTNNNNNISEDEEEILNSLNIPNNNNNKSKTNQQENSSLKINEIDSKENKEEIKLEDDEEDKSNNPYIKIFESNEDRLYGITFQNSLENNNINFAVSSLNMNTHNNISVVSFNQENEINEDNDENINKINDNNLIQKNNNKLKIKSKVDCEFPVSSILFSPHERNKNLLISTSDILRLYSYNEEQLSLKAELTKRRKDYVGPLTACDWSRANDAIIGVCSVDTSCAIWDLNKMEVRDIIIAHDKEVYDISLGKDEFTFMSTGADGSIRLFDSRSPDSSSIIFETIDENPMTRIKWNLINPNFLLTVIIDKNEIYIVDQRNLSAPYAILKVHTNVVNNAIWAPGSNTNLISVSDDKSALLWDIYCDSDKPEEYILEYKAEREIENVAWGDVTQNWVGIVDGNQAEILRIQ